MAINKSWLNPANLPATNPVNFPALKHFFPVTETSGETLTDTQSGVVLSGFTDLSFANGSVSSVNGLLNATPLGAGNWYPAGTNDFLFFCVANLAANDALGTVLLMGDSLPGHARLRLAAYPVSSYISDGTNSTTATAIPTSASTLGAFGVLRRGANLVSFICSGTVGGYAEQANVAITAGTNIVTIPQTTNINYGFVDMYSIEFWSFANGIYPDVASMVNWSVGSRASGSSQIKTPYPAWVGRT